VHNPELHAIPFSCDILTIPLCPCAQCMQTPNASKYGPWVGGAVLGKVLGGINTCFVSRADYDDAGPKAVHRKCGG
jgi:actin-related protein